MHLNTKHTRLGLRRTIAIFGMVGFLFLLTTAFTFPTYAATHGTSVASHATANGQKGAVPAIINRCQEGYACFYPGTGWNGGHPTQEWYRYGTYTISGWTGNHRVFNNQTGGALFWLCTDSFGENCPIKFAEDQSGVVNLGPIFSVKLTP
jgi:ABC-type dipeptide/oligopeptide/nickel transport system permease subunit